MSYREIAKSMIDRIPEDKMIFVINILANLGELSGVDVYPEFTPNEETQEAIAEIDRMIETGASENFSGSTEDFLASLLED
ncbi:MAG: hypothetical protein LUD18_12940 [Lachnospiraceae bacterium]|nr:hypothetical protein [Lachnospiraceae bacterium]